MNKKNKANSSVWEYLTTVIVTIIALFSVCLCIQLQLYFNIETIVAKKELEMKNLAKFYNIEQLEKMYLIEPKNYYIAINLAKAYETIEMFDLSNNLYREAVINSENSNYSIYSYGMFCARMGWYGLAADLAEEFLTKNKTVYGYKAEIYEELAKTLDEKKEYEASVKAYQIALKYAKNARNRKFLENIKDKYSKEYIKLADYNISQNKINDAVLNLDNSLKIKEQDIAKYKLALIYRNTDKYKSEKYFNDVLKSNPYIVNPDIYNRLLNDLILETKDGDNFHSKEFYQSRLNNFINKIQKFYIYKGDIIFSNTSIIKNRKLFGGSVQHKLCFTIKNNTQSDIESLYVKASFLIDEDEYQVTKKVTDNSIGFGPHEILKDVKIDLPEDIVSAYNDKNAINKNIEIKYYVKKQKKAPWTLAKIEAVKF